MSLPESPGQSLLQCDLGSHLCVWDLWIMNSHSTYFWFLERNSVHFTDTISPFTSSPRKYSPSPRILTFLRRAFLQA